MIWREGYTDEAETADCNGDFGLPPFANSLLSFTETVRFDERENPTLSSGCGVVSPCPPGSSLKETQLLNINGGFFPNDPSSDTGGWLYLNMAHGIGDVLGTYLRYGRPSQNWVQVRMTGAGLYGVDFDAAYLGNGCTPIFLPTGNGVGSATKIGPKWDRLDQEWSGN